MRPFSLPSTAPPAPGNSGAPRERTNPNHRSIQWPSIDGWLPVAYEALRVAHAAHCGAMALKGRSLHLDASRFLTRRAETLAHLIDALAIESRCEDNLREMDEAEVLTGLADAKNAEVFYDNLTVVPNEAPAAAPAAAPAKPVAPAKPAVP